MTVERLYLTESQAILVEFGETESTRSASFRAQCRACYRQLAALSRRNLPADAPSEDEVRAAAVALLVSLGCVVGEEVCCSYCAPWPPRTRGPHTPDVRSWELRNDGEASPVSRADWLVWPGEEAD